MRFGIINSVKATDPQDEWDRFNQVAESAGFHHVSVGDVQTRMMEMTVNLTRLALTTERIWLGPTISNPVTRHPGVMAAAFASLQALSGGRAWLGIATGNSALRNLGLSPARLEDVASYVRAFRDLLEFGATEVAGQRCILPWAPEAVPAHVPVYVAANGPRSLHLAGRIGDGVIVGGGVTQEVIEYSLSRIEDGARSAKRSFDEIDVWFQADVLFTDRDGSVPREMLDILAAIGSRNFRWTFEGKGVPPEYHGAVRAFEEEYRYVEHGGQLPHNSVLLERHGLAELFAELWLIGGTPETVRRRLEEIESWGVRALHVPGLSADPFELMRQFTAHGLVTGIG